MRKSERRWSTGTMACSRNPLDHHVKRRNSIQRAISSVPLGRHCSRRCARCESTGRHRQATSADARSGMSEGHGRPSFIRPNLTILPAISSLVRVISSPIRLCPSLVCRRPPKRARERAKGVVTHAKESGPPAKGSGTHAKGSATRANGSAARSERSGAQPDGPATSARSPSAARGGRRAGAPCTIARLARAPFASGLWLSCV
jgi:hypothetical protein